MAPGIDPTPRGGRAAARDGAPHLNGARFDMMLSRELASDSTPPARFRTTVIGRANWKWAGNSDAMLGRLNVAHLKF